ncbi:MAG: hypothetical protein ACFFCO_11790 [Promethearchaeota archaeon]
MNVSVQYVRRPRRIPDSDSYDEDEGPHARDFVVLFIIILVIGVALILVSVFQENLGLYQVAMGVRMFGFLTLFVAGGTGIMAGLAYLLTGSLVKRELEKRIRRIDQEREALLQQQIRAIEEEVES